MTAAGAGKGLSLIGVLDFNLLLHNHLIIISRVLRNNVITVLLTNSDRVTSRMNSSHMMKKSRLLNKALVTLSTLEAKLIHVALDVVVHGVLAAKCLGASFVRADK
jgi:hypothetical protein